MIDLLVPSLMTNFEVSMYIEYIIFLCKLTTDLETLSCNC